MFTIYIIYFMFILFQSFKAVMSHGLIPLCCRKKNRHASGVRLLKHTVRMNLQEPLNHLNSRSVSTICSVYHCRVPVYNPLQSLLFHLQCQRSSRQEDFHIEPGYYSLDRRRLLPVAFGIQNCDAG